MESITNTMSPRVCVMWQTSQELAIAECTDFPRTFAAWHVVHSPSFGITPGCSTALAKAMPPISRKDANKYRPTRWAPMATRYSTKRVPAIHY
jgi:hypothetical protein